MQLSHADITDSEQIIDLIRQGFEPHLLEAMIYGCHGVSNFVEDHIRLGPYSPYMYVVVKDADKRLKAAAEFRFSEGTLFLNYIAVHPHAQGQGLAGSLLRYAVCEALQKGLTHFSLDVFTTNIKALAWYTRLGLQAEGDRTFWVAATKGNGPIPVFSTPDFSHAESAQLRLGFSELTIHINGIAVRIGRLGRTYFRVPIEAFGTNNGWLAAVWALDPLRKLLVISPLPPPGLRQAFSLVSTRRMGIELKELPLGL